MTRRTLLLLALFAGPALTGGQEKVEVAPVPALPGEVPAGSPEDQRLWREARDAMVEGNESIRQANMALYDLRYAELDLNQLEKDAAPADAERLKAVRARLAGPAKALDAAIPRGSLGRCRYELLYFEQSMGGEPGTELAARLPAKRAEAQKCKDDHLRVTATLGPAVKGVRAALDEVGPEIRERMAAQAARAGATKDAASRPEAAK
jgi:hypothetical protein